MNDQILEILLKAKAWMLASELAAEGKWRSQANVGLQLKHLETSGYVVSRKSPDKRDGQNRPLTEWRHASRADLAPKPAARAAAVPPPATAASAAPRVASELRQDDDLSLRAQITELEHALSNARQASALAQASLAEIAHENDDLETANAALRKRLDVLSSHSQALSRISAIADGYLSDASTQTTLDGVEAMAALIAELREQVACDVRAAVGYLVRVPKRPPLVVKSRDTARSRALAAARAGMRGDVFALVPEGSARPGAEWKDFA